MIANRAKTVFLRGHWSYRSAFAIRSVILALVLAAITCFFSTSAIAIHPIAGGMSFFVGVLLCLVGILAFVVGVACLWSFAVGKVDELEISDQGVRYGTEFWPWSSVSAIRFHCLPRAGPIRVVVWPRKDRGPGGGLLTDEVFSSEELRQLERALKEYFTSNNLSIVYECD